MYDLEYSGQFKRDYKMMKKRGVDITLLHAAFEQLKANGQVDAKHRPHVLSGNWSGFWECHISPDWLLIYDVADTIKLVRLVRTGSHSELFGKKKR